MKKSLLLSILLATALPCSAAETRFSAMVSDTQTGYILTADRIDAPRDPSLLGRLAVIAMAIQDIADEMVFKEDVITAQKGHSLTVQDAMELTALGEPGYRAAMTALVNEVGQNPRLLRSRLEEIAEMAGLQATEIHVERGKDGGPEFTGYTTSRDLSRLATSLVRAFPEDVALVFGASTGNIPTTDIWLYEDGECLLTAKGPTSGRKMSVVMTGAPDQSNCLEKSARLIARDDARVTLAAQAR